MRHYHVCFAAVLLSAILLGDARLTSADASSPRDTSKSDEVLVINTRTYWWELPEFRMAGEDAYMVIEVENAHSYPVKMNVSCRTRNGGRVPGLAGRYTIPPRKFLRIDTRKRRGSLQKGEGVRVKCRFRADGYARVKAWVYDSRA